MKLIPTAVAGGLLVLLAVAAVPPNLPDPATETTPSLGSVDLANTQNSTLVTPGGSRISLASVSLSPELLELLEAIQAQSDAGQVALEQVHPSTPGLEDANVISHGPRITYKEFTEAVEIPFGTTEQDDPESIVGTRTLVTAGVAGLKKVTWVVTYSDEEEIDRAIDSEVIVREASDEIVAVGTKAPPPPPPAVPAGEAQEIAKVLVSDRGWDDGQFSCLVALWNRESGWRTTAGRLDGPYGIPQSNPGSKMASAGPDWQTDATTQIIWGLGYIAGRYGTPCGAWEHFQSVGWY
jgi:hypothetical protein